MAAITSLTKAQVRQRMMQEVLNRDDYVIDTPSTITSATSVTFAQIAGLYADGHFAGGSMGITVTAATQRRRLSAFTGSSGLFTIVGTGFSATPTSSVAEVVRAGISLEQFDACIEAAFAFLRPYLLVDATDETIMLEWSGPSITSSLSYPLSYSIYNGGRQDYPLPSYARVYGVQIDNGARIGGSEYIGGMRGTAVTEKTFAATTTQYAQAFKVDSPMECDAVWLYLRKNEAAAGNITGNLVVNIRSNNSGIPTAGAGGILMTSSNVVAATAVRASYGWVRFPFPLVAQLNDATTYHISLNVGSLSGLTAANYIAWQGTTDAGYSDGAPSTSANTGTSFTAESGYDLFFRVIDGKYQSWRDLNQDLDWTLPNGSTRTIRFTQPYQWSEATPVKILGGSVATSIDGVANDAVAVDFDSDTLLQHAIVRWQELQAMGSGDRMALQIAAYKRQDAERAIRARMKPRGKVVERN